MSSTTFEKKTTSDNKLNSLYVDLLTEDPIIPNQQYGCYSFVSPEKIIKQKDSFMFEQFVKQWQYSKAMSMYSDFTQFLSAKYSINPESLLANFMLGDSKSDILTGRLFMPIAFYLLLIGCAFISAYSRESNTSIYIMLIFVIGFSFWMRTIFVQDCSLNPDKDIYKDKESKEVIGNLACTFEKYGGLQAIIATCFLINMLSYIKDPTYKAFVFIIILLGSGLLTNLFILNIKSDGSNTEAKKSDT